MTDWTEKYLPELLNHRMGSLDAGKNMVYPQFQGGSIANLPGSISSWLGVPGFGMGTLSPEYLQSLGGPYRRVILYIVDGVGLHFFRSFLNRDPWKQWADRSQVFPLTSICPSTTSSALTTFWTGQPPAVHGVMGYEVWLKEYGMVANMITHSPASMRSDVGLLSRAGFDPFTFVPVPVMGEYLGERNIQSYAVQHASIAHSGLSQMLFRGSKVKPFISLTDCWVTIEESLNEAGDKPVYLYCYYPEIDSLEHRYGPANRRPGLEMEMFGLHFEKLVRMLESTSNGDTLLLMTADHGHIDTPINPVYELLRYPDLCECFSIMPHSENRLPFVFLRSGREAKARELLQKYWPDEFVVLSLDEVLEAGLFGSGKAHPLLRDRLGDWIVIPQGNAYWWPNAKPNFLLGRHGGLSEIEMLVPLFGMSL